jgi:hypothetical protein
MAGRKALLQQQKSVANLQTVVRQHGLEVNVTGFEEIDAGSHVNFIFEVFYYSSVPSSFFTVTIGG